MLQSLRDAGIFLIQFFFDMYSYALILRLLLQWLGASFYNPFSQNIVTVTNSLVLPLRRVIRCKGAFDYGILLLILLVGILKLTLLSLIAVLGLSGFSSVLLAALGESLHQSFNIFFYAIIGSTLLNWFVVGRHPIAEILDCLAQPLLVRLGQVLRPIGGFDITPLAAILLIKVSDIVIVEAIMRLAVTL